MGYKMMDNYLRKILAEELDRQSMHQAADDIRNKTEELANSGAALGMYHDKLLIAALASLHRAIFIDDAMVERALEAFWDQNDWPEMVLQAGSLEEAMKLWGPDIRRALFAALNGPVVKS